MKNSAPEGRKALLVANKGRVGGFSRQGMKDELCACFLFSMIKHLPALIDMKLIEMANPEKPNSSKQKYFLSDKGKAILIPDS